MVKKLQKFGNSQALVIDKALMEAMGISMDTPLTLTLTGNTLSIRPSNVGVGPEAVDAVMDKIESQFGDALTRLSQ